MKIKTKAVILTKRIDYNKIITMIVDKQDVTITMTPQEFNQLRKDFENIMGYISSLEEALEVEKDDAFYTHAPKFRELALFLGVDYRPL